MRNRIGLIILSLIAAAGWSAFFWLPALFERKWIASYAFEFARGQVADNAWRWSTIINWHLPFAYAPEQFYRVGILQLLLALVGYFCWTQRTWEWRFWGVVTVLTALGITQPFVPITECVVSADGAILAFTHDSESAPGFDVGRNPAALASLAIELAARIADAGGCDARAPGAGCCDSTTGCKRTRQ